MASVALDGADAVSADAGGGTLGAGESAPNTVVAVGGCGEASGLDGAGRAHLFGFPDARVPCALGFVDAFTDVLAPFTRGALVGEVRAYTGSTPYVRWGNGPAVMASLALLAFARRRKALS